VRFDVIHAARWVSVQPGIEAAPEFGRGEFHLGLLEEGWEPETIVGRPRQLTCQCGD
jgi:hypothetical protein